MKKEIIEYLESVVKSRKEEYFPSFEYPVKLEVDEYIDISNLIYKNIDSNEMYKYLALRDAMLVDVRLQETTHAKVIEKIKNLLGK